MKCRKPQKRQPSQHCRQMKVSIPPQPSVLRTRKKSFSNRHLFLTIFHPFHTPKPLPDKVVVLYISSAQPCLAKHLTVKLRLWNPSKTGQRLVPNVQRNNNISLLNFCHQPSTSPQQHHHHDPRYYRRVRTRFIHHEFLSNFPSHLFSRLINNGRRQGQIFRRQELRGQDERRGSQEATEPLCASWSSGKLRMFCLGWMVFLWWSICAHSILSAGCPAQTKTRFSTRLRYLHDENSARR